MKKLIASLIALGLGVVLVFAYQSWVLAVRMETDPQPSCFRVGVHILFQERADSGAGSGG